jgi:hypothetical protein
MWRFVFLFITVTMGLFARAQATFLEEEAAKARATVQRALPYLDARGRQWKADHGCASCHHVPMMVWSLREAGKRRFEVDQKAIAEMTDWILDDTNAASIVPAKGAPFRPTSEYVLLAVADEAQSETNRISGAAWHTQYLLEHQTPEGSWPGIEGRPPIMLASREATLVAANLLSKPTLVAALGGSDPTAIVDHAKSWLNRPHAAGAIQELNFAYLNLLHLDPSSHEVAHVRRLIERGQRPDGGWSQTEDRASDAFATGQSLYALSKAAHAVVPESATTRAAHFLEQTQREDGTWSMISRAVKPGDPGLLGQTAVDSEPIVYYATGWAILGLLQYLDLVEARP